MKNVITESLFEITQVAKAIETAAHNDAYKGSPFYDLKIMSSKTKGAKTEHLFKEIMEVFGNRVSNATNTDHDCVINGNKVELKASFMWKGTNNFRFQQIRPDQDYDYIVFMSFYPDRCELHVCDKKTAKKNLEVQDEQGNWIYNQHGGKTTNSGTFFIDCNPNEVDWMEPLENQLNA